MNDTKTNQETDTPPSRTAIARDDVQVNEKQVNDMTNKVLVKGEVFDNWPQDLFIPPDALEVFLETFQGPLDLLLYLIRKQNLDILDIPVARITKQYMEYVEMMRKFRLDLAAEYLVMAAMLAEIKSRLLLPRPPADGDEDDEDPRAALVRRLQEYERFSRAGIDLNERPRLERELYLVSADFEDSEPVKIESRASLNDLAVAFRNVLERSEMNKHFYFGRERLTVREKMTQILDRVRTTHFVRFEDLFDPQEGKPGLVVSFMAILELARDDMLIVMQNEPFTPIHLKSVASGST
ncbi:segregation and condensation protein A [Candidatus Spongiihabitans sp.]|uniref:segregation and condensation protein A n=1 Tax=Candidatus Spongiihabitans sp. TaxID=3101308 RepID=UPI003C7EA5CC